MAGILDRLTTALEGRYRIERELGAGGMATVYLAEDLKHHRQVGIKVLKPELAAVLGAERFVQEITTTAQLQHPHILPLFDSGTADGFLFYVMPYIEGETLREKLDRETQLGIEESVRIAREVADALDYAHRRGIIHRDIKPENILLHDGRPMVADFGIALAVSAAAGGRMTETGTSLGTPHYMSPEQATADKEITARSDVYSLASVLYEMLAGDPPHTGSSAQQVIMKIITDAPRPVTDLRRSVPSNVAAALSKALERLPADRFDSARSFASALADPSFRYGEEGGVAGASATSRIWQRAAIGLAVVAGALAVALAVLLFRSDDAPEEARYRLEMPAGDARSIRAAISPDGFRIAYTVSDSLEALMRSEVRTGLWVRSKGERQPTLIPGTGDAVSSPSFSPDGKRIAFISKRSDLKIASFDGTQPVTLARDIGFSHIDWGDDGYIYGAYSSTNHPFVIRFPEGGGDPDTVVSDRNAIPAVPDVLPGGRGILITLWTSADPRTDSIGVFDPAEDSVRVLAAGSLAKYANSGHLLIRNWEGHLLAAPFDLEALELRGTPTVIAAGIVGFAVSRAGDLLYVEGTPGTNVPEIVWIDRAGNTTDAGWPIEGGELPVDPALSPEGTRLALSVPDGDTLRIFVRDVAGGPVTALGGSGMQLRPGWSRDGREIGMRVGRRLVRRRSDGSGRPETILELPAGMDVGHWSMDQPTLALEAYDGLYAFTAGVDSVPVALLADSTLEDPTLSPDGRWVAYEAMAAGEPQIFVRPFPNVEDGRTQVSADGGVDPRWSGDGRQLFFSDFGGEGDRILAAHVRTEPAFAVDSVEPLFIWQQGIYQSRDGWLWEPAPDGHRFLVIRYRTQRSVVSGFVLIENFFAELRAKPGR